jgi:hypothetical protein
MNSLERLVRGHARAISESPIWLRAVSLVLLFSMFGFSMHGVCRAYSMPAQIEEPVALVNYQHNGLLDHTAYINPGYFADGTYVETTEDEERALYFTNIIDNIDIGFDYGFVSEAQVTNQSSEAEIVAIVTGPSGWQKEVLLHSESNLGSSFTVNFPLELEEFDGLINDIEEELGFRSPEFEMENAYTLVIEARVHCTADVEDGHIDDIFVQSMQIDVNVSTLRWDNQLALAQRKSSGGFSYKHQGSFSYTLALKENSLYGSGTIIKEPYEWPSASTPMTGNIYFNRITDVIVGSFSYQFLCDKPVNELTEEVEVTAILENPEVWSKTFVLVTKTYTSGDFRVGFALDVNYLAELTDTLRNELGYGPMEHALTIMATVHTTAETDFGKIDEYFTYPLEGTLGSAILAWDDEPESSKSGSIMSTHLVSNTRRFMRLSRSEARTIFPAVAGAIFPFAIYLLVINVAFQPPPPSRIEREARRAKKKHRGLFTDVKELPEVEDGATTVISVNSLDDLVTIAENLFKPVLYKAGEERYVYCVIDGVVRYIYVNELEPPDKYTASIDEDFPQI